MRYGKNMKPEDKLSADLKTALDRLKSRGIFSGVYFHVPNEFKPSKNFFAAWDKKEKIGCVSGAPDWVIAWRDGTLLVELKAKKTMPAALNAMRDGQRNFAKDCNESGVEYEVCISVDQVICHLKRLGAFGKSFTDNLPELA